MDTNRVRTFNVPQVGRPAIAKVMACRQVGGLDTHTIQALSENDFMMARKFQEFLPASRD